MKFAKSGRRWDMERFSFNDWRHSSEYTQPPLAAVAVNETLAALGRDSDEAVQFLSDIYRPLRLAYQYFEQPLRRNSDTDLLIGIIHPHESGRDSDPTFDFIKKLRLARKGEATSKLVDFYNIAPDYLGAMAINMANAASRWDLAEAREHFWVNDVMFNCIYIDNLYEMATLARDAGQYDDMKHFYGLAQTIERQIIDQMYAPEARGGQGAYLALRPEGKIDEISISNLFPLILPNLPAEHLKSILDLMDSSFNTPFPLPSVATDSPSFDPHYQEKGRLWRGPTWINTNWYLVERGLKRQAARPLIARQHPELAERCLVWAARIAQASKLLIEQGYYEFYDPITSKGLRVPDFSWSTLGDTL